MDNLKIQENLPIANLTTMRLGGNVRYVVTVNSSMEIPQVLEFARQRNLPYWVMGSGANTIGRDGGFHGVIILNQIKGIYIGSTSKLTPLRDLDEGFSRYLPDEIIIQAMAGEIWDDVVELACNLGYSGIEAMSKIPSTVGAAPVQNIGAYGQDMAAVIQQVEALDTKTGQFVKLKKDEMKLGYRHTRFNHGQDKDRFIITSVTMKLRQGQIEPPFYNSLQRYIDEHQETDFSPKNIRRMVSTIRAEKLPDPARIASSGSFFTNVYLNKAEADIAESKGTPLWRNADGGGKINAGWLIEQCGFKGQLLHGFRVSEKAALVLINESARNYTDLAKARAEIVAAVEQRFGYRIEQEPVEIGDEA